MHEGLNICLENEGFKKLCKYLTRRELRSEIMTDEKRGGFKNISRV